MPAAPATEPAHPAPAPGTVRPRLTLQTLTRGDGLLGLRPVGVFGPRGVPLTVARVEFVDAWPGSEPVARPAPTSVLGPTRSDRPLNALRAERDAMDALRDSGLHPLPADGLQWRTPALAAGHADMWSLPQEDFFGDFWADEVPRLQAAGWQVVVQPGFAHLSATVDEWRLVLAPAESSTPGGVIGHEPAGIAPRPVDVNPLRPPPREGSWLLTLGITIAGEELDLAPLLADLLKRDGRWLDAAELAAISDHSTVRLRAPGGRRIEAPAAPLKAIVGSMLELLTDPLRRDGPLRLAAWDAHRLDALRLQLQASQARRAGPHGAWALQGTAGLHALAASLRQAEAPSPDALAHDPPGLGIELRGYQRHGLAWLQTLRAQHLGGILADDMGLGKTAQALAHVWVEKQAGRLDAPALVLLPTTLLFNWQAEAARVAPGLRVLTWHGADRGEPAGFDDADLVLTTYTLAWREVTRLQGQRFHLLILDEAQTVKNAGSRAADAVRRIDARHRLCLTGTPLENHLGELWAQFDFLMPGFLGDARSFHRLWRKPIEENGETLRAQLLAQRVRPFVLRRRKSEVATELPPKTERTERLSLTGRQRELYESVRVAADKQVRRALVKSGFKGAQIAVLDALLKLRQVCCDPALVKGRSLPQAMERAKIEWLRRALPELLAEGRRVLVFSQFTEMLALLEAELAELELPWLALTGDTPSAQRGRVVERFQAGDVPLLLLSLKAGGLGLNLTAADTVVHIDPWWNPAVEAQATDRAHRIGQAQPVFVYKLVAAGSIEERILELQARKRVLADAVLGRDSATAMKFSEADLDGLLAPLSD